MRAHSHIHHRVLHSLHETLHSPLQLIALQDQTLAPSLCTFNILRIGGFVNEYQDFRREVDSNTVSNEGTSIPEDKTEAVEQIVKDITEYTLPQNEGYPQVLCTLIVSRTVKLLNEGAPENVYGFQIRPIVKKENDTRSDKESDLNILRILNRRTYVLIECKLSVASVITGDSKTLNDISQLLLEGIYVHGQEGRYRKLLLVLTDAIVWHFFTIDMMKKPLQVIKYSKIQDQEIAVQEVIRTLLYNVPHQL